MYRKGLGIINTTTGVTLLPARDSRALFVLAGCLIVSGLVIFVAATILTHKIQGRI